MINITDIRIKKPESSYNPELIYLCECVINNSIKLRDINICKNKDKLYISFPQRKTKSNKYYYMFNPVNEETRIMIQESILKAMGE